MLLAVNCGSSSIKFKLFQLPDLEVLVHGSASNVETKGLTATIKFVVHEHGHEEKSEEHEKEDVSYDAVFERIIELVEQALPRHSAEDITVIAHRVVHGGSETEPLVVPPGHDQVLDKLSSLSAFAPLHNRRAILVVKSCFRHLPKATQVLLFDTLFHSSIPEHIYTYPLSPSKESPIPLKKYGAHGLSYSSILRSVANHLKKPEQECNLVIAHLGSGASVCLVKSGKSFDTSMGLTPLDGLPGGTRSGAVDPMLIFHHSPDCGDRVDMNGVILHKGEVILNKQGGLQAICGTSDFGQISSRSDPEATLAYNLFLDRLLNYLGSYTLKLLGSGASLDAIVFSGGIGERSSKLRADASKYFQFLGLELDEVRNESAGKDSDAMVEEITTASSRIRMLVCKTDEETQCATMAANATK